MTDQEERMYKEAYEAFYLDVLQFCIINLYGDQSAAQEICQEAFLVLMDTGGEFSDMHAVRVFLFRTVQNLVRRMYRTYEIDRQKLLYLDDKSRGADTPELSYHVDFDNWLNLAVPIGKLKMDILMSLSEEEWILYSCYFLERLSPAEIGKQLGIKENAVNQRLHRLRTEIIWRVKELKLI